MRLIIPLIVDQFLQVAVGLSDSIMVARVGEAAVSGVSFSRHGHAAHHQYLSRLSPPAAPSSPASISAEKIRKPDVRATAQLFDSTFLFSIFIMILLIPRAERDPVPCLRKDRTGSHEGQPHVSSDRSRLDPDDRHVQCRSRNLPCNGKLQHRDEDFASHELYQRVRKRALIFGFHCGVEGVAIPTVVSRGVACVVILVLLNNQEHALHILHPYPFKIKWDVLKRSFYIGIPNGLENSMFQLGKIAVLSLVSGLGTASLAANAVSNNIANFAILPGMSFGFALLTVCAQCVGAGDFEQVEVLYQTHDARRVSVPDRVQPGS